MDQQHDIQTQTQNTIYYHNRPSIERDSSLVAIGSYLCSLHTFVVGPTVTYVFPFLWDCGGSALSGTPVIVFSSSMLHSARYIYGRPNTLIQWRI